MEDFNRTHWLEEVLRGDFLRRAAKLDTAVAADLTEAMPILGTEITNEYSELRSKLDKETGLRIVEIPVGFRLYKGRFKPAYLLQDPHNSFADKITWFGPKRVADLYNNDASGRRYFTYELIVQKPIRLLVLLDKGNATKIMKKLVSMVRENPDRADLLINFAMATGFGVTYDEQLAYYKSVEKVYTPVLLHDEFHGMRFLQNKHAMVSKLRTDFHRVSIRTSLDADMVQAICMTTGLDGYIMQSTPSFICQKEFCPNEPGRINFLSEEIALCNQRAVEISLAGRVPDYLGMQAALFLDRNTGEVVKYFFPTRVSRMVVEREKAASEALRGEPFMAPFRRFRRDPNTGYMSARREAWDTDLAALCLRRAPELSLKDLSSIFMQVFEACRTLYKKQVVHGDMKPENILVNHDKGKFRVAVSDFGNAKVLTASYKTFKINAQDRSYLDKQLDLFAFCLNMWALSAFLEQHPEAEKTWKKFRTTVLERFVKPDIDLGEYSDYPSLREALRERGFTTYHTWPHKTEPVSFDG